MPLTPRRRRAALAALALGGFGIGLTEFIAMGLLPEIAQSVLPGAWARSSSDAVASTGWVISVYALGVMAGAPTIAALTARVPRTRLVAGLLVMFVVGNLASALAPTFGLELAARFVAGLPHGAYFGAAGMVAATLMGPGNRARGYAVVLGGLTVANVLGVPLITGLGQATSWRVAYVAISVVFAVTLAAVLLTVPPVPAAEGGSPRAELAAFRAPQVWLVAATVAIGFAGFFAVYSYVSPVTTHVTGLGAGHVPWVLATAGLGMSVGIALGGRAADRDLRRTMVGGSVAIIVAVALFALFARHPVGLYLTVFAVGATSLFVSPAMQSRLIQVAPGAQLMGAAVNQSAGNLANSLGAALGGLAIATGLGYLAPAVVGVGLGVVGLLMALLSFALDARSTARERELVDA